jgi:prevent-host-death family protein
MPTTVPSRPEKKVVSMVHLRTNLGKMLDRMADDNGSFLIEKRGKPKAFLLSIHDYVRLAAPEPEALRLIGELSVRNGTDKLTSRQIDQIIKQARAERKKR